MLNQKKFAYKLVAQLDKIGEIIDKEMGKNDIYLEQKMSHNKLG